MEKEILLLKEEILALRQQKESLNKKLKALNLNLTQKYYQKLRKNSVFRRVDGVFFVKWGMDFMILRPK